MRKIIPITLNRKGSWPRRGIRNVIVHHSAGVLGNRDRAHSEMIIKGINDYHQSKNWGGGAAAPGITYHFAMDLVGNIWLLNNPNRLTWHAGNSNSASVGVVVLGDFEKYQLTKEEQKIIKKSFDVINRYMFFRYFIGRKAWKAHKDVKATKCCGKYLYSVFKEWKNRI